LGLYTPPISAGSISAVDLAIDGGDASAAARAEFSPGGVRRWAAWPAQPSAAGPRAHAGGVGRPRASFCCWPNRQAVNSSISYLSFEFQKLFCFVFLFYLLFFIQVNISV
jgi:hypothetical protein